MSPTNSYLKWTILALALLAFSLGSCFGGGDDQLIVLAGPPGPPGAPGPDPAPSTELDQGDELPGLTLEIVAVTGGTGPGGNFLVGDFVSVNYTLTYGDGSPVVLSDLSSWNILVSGPTFNYQLVLARKTDGRTLSVLNPDGSFTYTFADPIPAAYLPPLNDTTSFGADDGELQGMPLLDGTYTVGMRVYRSYDVSGSGARDAANAVYDFLFGAAPGALAHREVVTRENCNQCHGSLRAHGGTRQDLTFCLLCHTAGSEDRNTGGITPGASVEFSVMIHKIHTGRSLPSVLGVTTVPGGARDYTATPKPYELVGFNAADFSNVGFPRWPNLTAGMPEDKGYGALAGAAQDKEDLILEGPTDCVVCHGDPDGGGPLVAPAQGDQAYTNQTRRACGACHDDIVWTEAYAANGPPAMPAQTDDLGCLGCHPASGDPLSPLDAHIHPLNDPAIWGGLNFTNVVLTEESPLVPDGTIDPGEKFTLTFDIEDDLGSAIDAADLDRLDAVIAGPIGGSNSHRLYRASRIEFAIEAGGPPYTMHLPMEVGPEFLGLGTDGGGLPGNDVFNTTFTPLYDPFGEDTEILEVTAVGPGTTLTEEAIAAQTWVDVLVDVFAILAEDDIIVIDEGGPNQEYAVVEEVDPDNHMRVFLQAGLRLTHDTGEVLSKVTTTTLTEGTHYVLMPATGEVAEDEDGDFTDGSAILAVYTTDWVMPDVFPAQKDDEPEFDETYGSWLGKPITDGTYQVGFWGRIEFDTGPELTGYRGISPTAIEDFLVGDATTLETYSLMSSLDTCTACHEVPRFHGSGRIGVENCNLCHSTPYAEFRTILHEVHMGRELAVPVSGLNPNVAFPVMPGEARNCATCHGDPDADSTDPNFNDAWLEPGDRDHPTDQVLPAREWRTVCASCHNSPEAISHIDGAVAGGVESCAVCHGEGREQAVQKVHKAY